jgi:hypothetical protein
VWRDDTGWYHLHYRDRQAIAAVNGQPALGDEVGDLAGIEKDTRENRRGRRTSRRATRQAWWPISWLACQLVLAAMLAIRRSDSSLAWVADFDPDLKVQREVLKAAVVGQIFCEKSGRILDVRTAVLVTATLPSGQRIGPCLMAMPGMASLSRYRLRVRSGMPRWK